MTDILILLGAGFLAGAMNALAGGGSFVTLPALIAVGVPSVTANATSTVALYPGGAASAWVYRDGLTRVCGVPVRSMLVVTLVGGLGGALLLLWTPVSIFDRVLPWLLLVATLALAFGRRIGAELRSRLEVPLPGAIGIQFLLGVYGGYFGGAVGLMMLATWGMLGGAELKNLNAPRTLMVTASNTIAVVCFALAGVVAWDAAVVLGVAAVGGGVVGAVVGRRLSAAITAAFFVKYYS
jgi:uncharacterized membrane protein YfcA